MVIRMRWMDNHGLNPGWYVEVYEAGRIITDSQKVSFPIDVDDYEETEDEALVAALRKEYPNAEIEED
jgi:hypothetical protein